MLRTALRVGLFALAGFYTDMCLLPAAYASNHAPEVIAKISSLGKKERESFLVEGAKKEGEVMLYGSSQANEFNEMIGAFNKRYPFIKGNYFRGQRYGLVNRVELEWKTKKYTVDIIQSVLYQGAELLQHKGLVQQYASPERAAYHPLYYAKDGSWYSYRTLITALVYNKKLVKPNEVPKTYEDLLQPRWKGGQLLFDRVADYMIAAFEHAWGKDKALDYMKRLSAQKPAFQSSHTMEVNLVAAGEYPITIEVNADSAAEVRDKGAPIEVVLLKPYISKPHAMFLARNAPHPHAAILFHDWLLSAEGQTVWGKNMASTIARKDVVVQYPQFQVDPDFALTPETYANRAARERYGREFREIFGLAK
jgi:iron(III) transport system substrate-binding protein